MPGYNCYDSIFARSGSGSGIESHLKEPESKLHGYGFDFRPDPFNPKPNDGSSSSCTAVRDHPHMTSTVWGRGTPKVDKMKEGCETLYVTRGEGVQKSKTFADVFCGWSFMLLVARLFAARKMGRILFSSVVSAVQPHQSVWIWKLRNEVLRE